MHHYLDFMASGGLPAPRLSTLFIALFLLALAPNLSVLIVATRAATRGFRQGVWATAGVVAATLLHMVFALFVLLIAAAMRDQARDVLRLIAAVYLVWTGLKMILNAARAPQAMLPPTQRSAASFATGFLLTLLNLKAIVLYVCLLPVFLTPGALGFRGLGAVLGVVAAAGFLARLAYVIPASRGRIVPGVRTGRLLNVVAGAVVAAAGAVLATASM